MYGGVPQYLDLGMVHHSGSHRKTCRKGVATMHQGYTMYAFYISTHQGWKALKTRITAQTNKDHFSLLKKTHTHTLKSNNNSSTTTTTTITITIIT
jgi:hypothetical protein